jgi:N utilization substance protein A
MPPRFKGSRATKDEKTPDPQGPEALVANLDQICREKNIDREVFFDAIELALVTAVRRKLEDEDETIEVKIDRTTGEIYRTGDAAKLDTAELGRIAIQTAKQVLMQKIREAESDQVYDEYFSKRGEIITGVVQRVDSRFDNPFAQPRADGRVDPPNLTVNIGGRLEASFPRREQIFDERFNIGDRVRAVLLDVRRQGQRVRATVSRASPMFVRRLFEIEVPEIGDRIIEIKAIEREAGYRSKVAVTSHDMKVDCVGACVGQRGSRIKGIIDELNGEKIDIVRWADSPDMLIQNALRPARIKSITLDYDRRIARLVVPDDQLSLAIGKRGQNVRLGAKLCRWDFHIITETQEAAWRTSTVSTFKALPGVTDEMAYKIFDADFESYSEIYTAGIERLLAIDGMTQEMADEIYAFVAEHQSGPVMITDAVYAEGAYRMPDGRYLEPGQARPGEFRISADDPSKGVGVTGAEKFGALWSTATDADGVPTGPTRETLGDIFANERD